MRARLIDSEHVKSCRERLFEKLSREPGLMPGYLPGHALERTVCDYIAGMTDRFAANLLEKLNAD